MKAVMTHIMRRKRRYATLPFFACLRDERLPPRVRLGFMPGFAFFVMAFGDLNRYVPRKAPVGDAQQARVNAHTCEDDHHWPWFLEDLDELSWNRAATTTDALRALWSEDTHRCRLLMYEPCAIVEAADGVERLAIVEAIEETGNVLFALTIRLAAEVQAETGRELRYMGAHHFALETGHMRNGEHAKASRIVLDDAKRRRCIALVDRVFDSFAAWTHEAVREIARAASPRRRVRRRVETIPSFGYFSLVTGVKP